MVRLLNKLTSGSKERRKGLLSFKHPQRLNPHRADQTRRHQRSVFCEGPERAEGHPPRLRALRRIREPLGPFRDCARAFVIQWELLVADHAVHPKIRHLHLQRVATRLKQAGYIQSVRVCPEDTQVLAVEFDLGDHLDTPQI